MGKPSADVVTVSHHSPNHSFTSGVENNPRVVAGPGEYEVADVLIGGVATTLQPNKGPLNTAYTLRFDEMTVCHLGDISGKLTNEQIEALGNIDVLFIPVGGGGALGPAQAAEMVAKLEPSLVVPMHYRIDGEAKGDLEPVDGFCREMGSREWKAEPKLTVTRSSLPSEVRVAVLENKRV